MRVRCETSTVAASIRASSWLTCWPPPIHSTWPHHRRSGQLPHGHMCAVGAPERAIRRARARERVRPIGHRRASSTRRSRAVGSVTADALSGHSACATSDVVLEVNGFAAGRCDVSATSAWLDSRTLHSANWNPADVSGPRMTTWSGVCGWCADLGGGGNRPMAPLVAREVYARLADVDAYWASRLGGRSICSWGTSHASTATSRSRSRRRAFPSWRLRSKDSTGTLRATDACGRIPMHSTITTKRG